MAGQGAVTRKAPRYLRAPTRRWWEEVVSTWGLESHHVLVLTATCEALDLLYQANQCIQRDGLVTTTQRGGARANPAVKIALEARLQVYRGIRELDLDLVPPAEARSRPPALRSIAR
jgi:P27 family predicted phage terminase small subunit